jgi:hypothetical protein
MFRCPDLHCKFVNKCSSTQLSQQLQIGLPLKDLFQIAVTDVIETDF